MENFQKEIKTVLELKEILFNCDDSTNLSLVGRDKDDILSFVRANHRIPKEYQFATVDENEYLNEVNVEFIPQSFSNVSTLLTNLSKLDDTSEIGIYGLYSHELQTLVISKTNNNLMFLSLDEYDDENDEWDDE